MSTCGGADRALQIDVAGRAEHYTDFGDTQIGKITARYDFSPQLARTRHHLDRLPRSHPGGRILHRDQCLAQQRHHPASGQLRGSQRPGPFQSQARNIDQLSAGVVAHPLEDLSVTVDAYTITLGDRIVASGKVFIQGGAINTTLVNTAIAVAGNVP